MSLLAHFSCKIRIDTYLQEKSMTKTIKLTLGKHTTVSDNFYEELCAHEWCAMKHRDGDYYASRKTYTLEGKRITLLMHREIMGLQIGDPRFVDHIDKNKLNNEYLNLRICNRSQNASNRGKQANNTSHYKGVYAVKGDKWKACIIKRSLGKNRTINLGTFSTRNEAAIAYNVAAKEVHGDFAFFNLIISEEELLKLDSDHIKYNKPQRERVAINKHGYRGVTFLEKRKTWQASITNPATNKLIFLGTFRSKEEAAAVWNEASIFYRGSSAFINLIHNHPKYGSLPLKAECFDNPIFPTYKNNHIRSSNKSGYKGVSWDKLKRKCISNIRDTHTSKNLYLGFFRSKNEAALAWNAKAIELYGNTTFLNIIELDKDHIVGRDPDPEIFLE